MRRAISNWLNEHGRKLSDNGNKDRATRFYRLASYVDTRWSVPWYNRGLQAKYRCEWQESLRCNQKAVLLDPADRDAWWNLGIAATALRNWQEAARAWRGHGIELLQDSTGEVTTPPVTACVRLDPDGAGEVVWGERIDPARLLILSAPLPESQHRFRDVVLNDGAANGKREWNGNTFPVFDELEIWQKSRYSTFRVSLSVSSKSAEDQLIELCRERNIGWRTGVRSALFAQNAVVEIPARTIAMLPKRACGNRSHLQHYPRKISVLSWTPGSHTLRIPVMTILRLL